jgi:hypothetical protein
MVGIRGYVKYRCRMPNYGVEINTSIQLSFFATLLVFTTTSCARDARTIVRRRYTNASRTITTVTVSTSATSPAFPTGTRSVCACTTSACGIKTSFDARFNAGASSATLYKASGTCTRSADVHSEFTPRNDNLGRTFAVTITVRAPSSACPERLWRRQHNLVY